MKIDLHVHTSERSPCATVNEEYQIQAAIQKGFDGIAITDHDRLVPAKHLQALNEQFTPFKVFTGIEVAADHLHWVVLGIHEPALESEAWSYADLLDFVRQRGGFILLAHPFRYQPNLAVDLDRYPPDGIEVESINTPAARKADIRAIASRLGLVECMNSDSHHPGGMGAHYNVLPRSAQDDRELIEVLHSLKKSI